MLKEVVLQHKAERDTFLKRSYVARSKVDEAAGFLETDLIKVITGPRRAGKSVAAFLLLGDMEFAYLNFDDEHLLKVDNYDELLKTIFEVYPGSQCLLFDEIQNLKGWELFVNKLHRRGHNLVVTGSNARLLSKELATALTGRYVEMELLPFSFREYLDARDADSAPDSLALPEKRGMLLKHLDDYLDNGGFPEVVTKDLEPRSYLGTLFDAVLFKDIVRRHDVRQPQRLYELAHYLASNYCGEFTSTRLKNALNFRSVDTVQNYLGYLEEAYLFFTLTRFSFKVGQQLRAPRKGYVVDNGLAAATSFQFSRGTGRKMENAVFLELIRRGFSPQLTLFYYRTGEGREVDFLLRSGTDVTGLVQVCYDLSRPEVKQRKLSALVAAGRELSCDDLVVVTWEDEGIEEVGGREVRLLPLYKWLLDISGLH